MCEFFPLFFHSSILVNEIQHFESFILSFNIRQMIGTSIQYFQCAPSKSNAAVRLIARSNASFKSNVLFLNSLTNQHKFVHFLFYFFSLISHSIFETWMSAFHRLFIRLCVHWFSTINLILLLAFLLLLLLSLFSVLVEYWKLISMRCWPYFWHLSLLPVKIMTFDNISTISLQKSLQICVVFKS